MNKILLVFIGIILLVFSGCSQSSTGSGTLELKLTDAPADFEIEKAEVTISGISVHRENSTENESSWITVVEEPQTYDLIELINVTTLLGKEELDVGRYTQIRLSIDSALVTIDGVEYDLKVPSESLKLVSGFTIEDNKTTTLTLDFDAKESIHVTGNNQYMLRPTIKIIQE